MKKQVFSFALAAALAISLLGSVQAQNPAPTPALKVGLIDIQRAILESDEGKKALEKLKTQFDPKYKELQGKQVEIERLQKELRERERALSDEARAKLVRQIETKTKDFNRSREDLSAEAQQAQGDVINGIGKKVLKFLDEYAPRNGYQLVLDINALPVANANGRAIGQARNPVVWSGTGVDLTDEIIRLYNTSLAASAATGATTGTSPAKPTSTSGTPAARRTP